MRHPNASLLRLTQKLGFKQRLSFIDAVLYSNVIISKSNMLK